MIRCEITAGMKAREAGMKAREAGMKAREAGIKTREAKSSVAVDVSPICFSGETVRPIDRLTSIANIGSYWLSELFFYHLLI